MVSRVFSCGGTELLVVSICSGGCETVFSLKERRYVCEAQGGGGGFSLTAYARNEIGSGVTRQALSKADRT
jgi:hypothetical protein